MHLPARLAGSPPPTSGALADWATGRISWRLGGRLPGPGFTHRAVLLSIPSSSHGATFVAHDGGGATFVARFAAVSHPLWFAGGNPHLLARALFAIPGVAALLRVSDASDHRLASLCGRHLALACANSV